MIPRGCAAFFTEMFMKHSLRMLLAVMCCSLCGIARADVAQVEVQALMKGSAMLRIGGQSRLLRAGERSPEGVLLVSSSPREAVIDVKGQRRTLNLSNRIAGNFAEPEQTEVQIARNLNHQYLTTAEINGRQMLVLVDTGANSVAMNGAHARSLGIDYLRKGTPVRVGTAGGVVQGYNVVLDEVSIGGISARYVEATVIDSDSPTQVLLGMTYLQHVTLRERDGIMYLRQKY
jgi:aspartyl protease family protein